jgi:hypothetical protein
MAGKKVGEGSKKASGQARKAEAAAAKTAAEEAKKAAAEESEWKKGSKDSSKKYVTCFFAHCWLTRTSIYSHEERSTRYLPILILRT